MTRTVGDDVKQWASKGSASASPADAGCLQISIEALFVSICQKSTTFTDKMGVDILTKKGLFDQKMLLSRLTEEKQILVKEMTQHCQYLKDSVSKVQTLMAPVSLITQTG
ncbi:hypothetical protein F7725_020137, partial [Dissostichus mawsoni]